LVCGQLGGLSSDFDSVLVGPPPSLASWVRNPSTSTRNRFVVAYRGLAGAVARSCVASLLLTFVRGSERESAGVTTAVAARYRGGPGR
jgi:hypothetical protein